MCHGSLITCYKGGGVAVLITVTGFGLCIREVHTKLDNTIIYFSPCHAPIMNRRVAWREIDIPVLIIWVLFEPNVNYVSL